MKRTNGSLARRARPLVAATTLVVSVALAFLPIGPAPVSALSPSPDPAASAALSPDPGPSIAPEPTPTVDPDPTPSPDPGLPPSPDPTPSPDPGLPPSPDPTPVPTRAPLPPGVISADGGTVDAGDVTITVPAGAVGGPTRFSVGRESGLPDFDGTRPLMGFSIATADAETGAAVGTFGIPVIVATSTGGLDLTDIDPAGLRLVSLAPDGTWQVLPTLQVDTALLTQIGAPGTFAVVDTVPARHVAVTLDHASNAPSRGRHRIEPGANLTVTIGVKPGATILDTRLTETIPIGWTVIDPGMSGWDPQSGVVTFTLGTAPAGVTLTRTLVVRAPLVSPRDGGPAFESTFAARLDYRGGSEAARDVTVLVAPTVVIEHHTLARVNRETGAVSYQSEDQPLQNEPRFQVFRIRFQARNADTVPVPWTPLLQFRPAGATAWTTVPDREYQDGVAFYVAPERLRPQADPASPDVPDGPEIAAIGTSEIRMHDRDDIDEQPAPGSHSMGPNPAPALTIPGRSYAEVEFSVRATVVADYLAEYEFRIRDAGGSFDGAATATVRIGPAPPLVLSPGQRQGIWVGGPSGAVSDAQGTAYGLQPPTGRVVDRSALGAEFMTADFRSTGPRYALLASAIVPPAPAQPALAAPVVGTHGPYSTTPDQCALCHRQHTGRNRSLLSQPPPQSNLCFTCHDGSGANANVKAQYTDATVPANNATTRSYYRHDALVATTHTRADLDEFGGLSNRHSECGDCHNAHRANATDSTQTATGWTASGRLANISGASVVNGAAGVAPTYTFLNGTTNPITREYQLCFKCHSGFTTLLANPAGTPTPYSLYALDKGVELNPSNASYHPIEAAGKNTTTAMTNQLAATSPYKQWTFATTSTIRCVNCHGDYRKYNQATPPAAGSDLAPHANQYRGVLLQNYRDRALMQSTEAYSAGNFALCFLCHGEAPFADVSGDARTDTNFGLHGYHLGQLPRNTSASYNIDEPGAGRGFAICAECHFRIHSTTYRVGTQPAYQRLVNFAPNVTVGSTPWNQTGRSCTLTCHGVSHRSYPY